MACALLERKMSLSKKQRERLLRENCGVIQDDDAIDPRHYFFNKRKSKNKFRKVFQLCRQVSDTLHFVLNEGDPELEGLAVIDVIPAPDARRMLVMIGISPEREIESASDIDRIMERLQSNIPRLRAEIARTINRKKTPQLIFEITKIG
jgi:ribosome-binding factor A